MVVKQFRENILTHLTNTINQPFSMFKRISLDNYQRDNLTTSSKRSGFKITNLPTSTNDDANLSINHSEEGFFCCEFNLKLSIDSDSQAARKLILSTMAQNASIFRTGKKPLIKFAYLGNKALKLFINFWLEEEVVPSYGLAEYLAIDTINLTSETLEKAGFVLLD